MGYSLTLPPSIGAAQAASRAVSLRNDEICEISVLAVVEALELSRARGHDSSLRLLLTRSFFFSSFCTFLPLAAPRPCVCSLLVLVLPFSRKTDVVAVILSSVQFFFFFF